jgi:hypothetical protein
MPRFGRRISTGREKTPAKRRRRIRMNEKKHKACKTRELKVLPKSVKMLPKTRTKSQNRAPESCRKSRRPETMLLRRVVVVERVLIRRKRKMGVVVVEMEVVMV